MKSIRLLDCTLRDGGYVNDWDFGHGNIAGIYKRLDNAGVEMIEVGFLDDRRPFDPDRTIMPSTKAINKIFANIPKKQAMPIAMIDFGTCSIDNIDPADGGFIEGIRVIFKKERIEQALPFCKAIKEKGYKLFIQAISITAYSESEMLDYIEKINEIKPYAFSIVDTYGLLDGKSMAHYFSLIDDNMDPEINLGYHGHNNFQLGFSNTMNFIEKETSRRLIADSTVYGMGKSAGNCPSELLAMSLNKYYGKCYDLNQLLEIVDTHLMPIYQKQYWGYEYGFYIASMQACHPNYVRYLLDKNTLSVSSVNEILATIPEKKKLLYDKDWVEEAYINYQNHNIDDEKTYLLLGRLLTKEILVLGPGSSVLDNTEKIIKLSRQQRITTISVNHNPNYCKVDFVFLSNAKRYSILTDRQNGELVDYKLITTSNINAIDTTPDYVLNYESLLSSHKQCADNSLLLLLRALIKLRTNRVFLAGFDGFRKDASNFYSRTDFLISKHDELYNDTVSDALRGAMKEIDIQFITPTQYKIDTNV